MRIISNRKVIAGNLSDRIGALGLYDYLIENTHIREKQPMSAALNLAPRHLVAFVHGFNESVDDACRKALLVDNCPLDHGSKVVPFCWPSDDRLCRYLDDRAAARLSAHHLAFLLGMVAERSRKGCTKKVSIVAHSMGCYLVAKALQELWECLGEPLEANILSELVFVGADLDDDFLHSQESRGALALSRRVTNYHSRGDAALAMSSVKRFGATGSRLGRSGGQSYDGNTWSVDMTPLGHGEYFSDKRFRRHLSMVLEGVDRKIITERDAAVPKESK